MLKGFKDFIMRGNLVEIAVGLVIALALLNVINALVAVIMDIIGKVGGMPDFSAWNPGGVSIGAFLTALIAFFVIAAAVYFLVVVPYNNVLERLGRQEALAPAEDVVLLGEIRDLLRARADGGTPTTTTPTQTTPPQTPR